MKTANEMKARAENEIEAIEMLIEGEKENITKHMDIINSEKQRLLAQDETDLMKGILVSISNSIRCIEKAEGKINNYKKQLRIINYVIGEEF